MQFGRSLRGVNAWQTNGAPLTRNRQQLLLGCGRCRPLSTESRSRPHSKLSPHLAALLADAPLVLALLKRLVERARDGRPVALAKLAHQPCERGEGGRRRGMVSSGKELLAQSRARGGRASRPTQVMGAILQPRARRSEKASPPAPGQRMFAPAHFRGGRARRHDPPGTNTTTLTTRRT